MRRLFVLTLACAAPLVVSCGGGGSQPFGNLSFRLRCPDGFAGCSSDNPPHPINGFSGDVNTRGEEILVQCTANEFGEGANSLVFNVRAGGASLRVDAIYDTASGTPTRCEVEVSEDGNAFPADSTQCAGGSPNPPTQPCSVSNVRVNEEGAEGREIVGDLVCRNLPSRSNPTAIQRDLTAATEDRPITFRFSGCDGNVL